MDLQAHQRMKAIPRKAASHKLQQYFEASLSYHGIGVTSERSLQRQMRGWENMTAYYCFINNNLSKILTFVGFHGFYKNTVDCNCHGPQSDD